MSKEGTTNISQKVTSIILHLDIIRTHTVLNMR